MSCAGVTGTAGTGGSQTCGQSNPPAAGWSPVVITVPFGQNLTVNLTNNLTFAGGNTVPTSLVIVGQVGGGLGTGAQYVASPTHENLGVTWPTVNTGEVFVPRH